MDTRKGFIAGKLGVAANPMTSMGGKRMGDGCPAGYVKNFLGVCMLAPITSGTYYYTSVLAGPRRSR